MKQPEVFSENVFGEASVAAIQAAMETGKVKLFRGKEWLVTGLKQTDNGATVEYTEVIRARPEGMQYIVVQGRQPQDGSKALEALVIFPAWVSATLMCAGVSGRVIELTDGSIKQQGRVSLDEAETLEALLEDEAMNAESQGATPEPAAAQARIEELTEVNYTQQRELAAQDKEIERLRLLLAGIRRLAKKGKA